MRNYVQPFFYLGCVAIISSFAFLEYCFLISDFSVQNVFFNSSTIKPLVFKIGAAWASHEGSMLLWISLASSVCAIYIFNISNAFKILKNQIQDPNCNIIQTQIKIMSLILLLFVTYIYFTSNPFLKFSFKPSQGLGLNPLLQDIALIIHPPILYLGYVTQIILFTICGGLLINSNVKATAFRLLLNKAIIFSRISVLFLTAGVALGSWWAYRELGWGGFWFFDPVENISLMPLLCGIALHHSILQVKNSNQALSWVLVLSAMTFLMSILGLFFVRSGLISSVHVFSNSIERGVYILVIFALLSFLSIICFAKKKHVLQKHVLLQIYNFDYIKSREHKNSIKHIICANWLWIVATIVILVSVIYPLGYEFLFQQKISISANYFVCVFIPLFIPMLLFSTLQGKSLIYAKHFICFCFAVLIYCLIIYFIPISLGALCTVFMITAIYVILTNICDITKICIKKFDMQILAKFIGHIGFALLVISITLNHALQNEYDFEGKVGDSQRLGPYLVKLQNVEFVEHENYYAQIASLWIQKNNQTYIVKPETRFYKIENAISQESDIISLTTHDIYAVSLNMKQDVLYAKIYHRPCMKLLWMSCVMICLGFVLGFLKNTTLYTSNNPRMC